ALDRAKDFIMEDEDFHKADIIFITDGESAIRDSWLEGYLTWKTSKEVNIYSVLIDSGWNSDVTLKEFSDKIVNLSKLEEDKDAAASQVFTLI
nr:hypothetical protein [bacterium]